MSTTTSSLSSTQETHAPAPFPVEGSPHGIQTTLFGHVASIGRASYRSNYAYLWQSEPATIAKHEWRVCVVEITDGHYAKCRDHVLEYRSSQQAAWKPQYEWPGYNCDKGGCGLPYQSNLLFKKHWGHIEEMKSTGRSWADGSAAEQRACSRAAPSAGVHCPPQRVASERDFLTIPADHEFQIVVMNPPFSRGLDMVHVTRALDHLAPGGCLVSVMSTGWQSATTAKPRAFRELVAHWQAEVETLPEGTFATSGTDIATTLLTFRSPSPGDHHSPVQ